MTTGATSPFASIPSAAATAAGTSDVPGRSANRSTARTPSVVHSVTVMSGLTNRPSTATGAAVPTPTPATTPAGAPRRPAAHQETATTVASPDAAGTRRAARSVTPSRANAAATSQ